MPMMQVVLPDDVPDDELAQQLRDKVAAALSSRVRIARIGERSTGTAILNTGMMRYSVEYETEQLRQTDAGQ